MYRDQSGEFVGGYRKKSNLKADLDGMIFAYDHHAQLAYIRTFNHPHVHNFCLGHPQCVIQMLWV